MFTIQILDNIASTALKLFEPSKYQLGNNMKDPDVILVRSHQLHHYSFSPHLKAVGRAGVGTDNIPVKALTDLGIPVFYAPGANANAVKELVLAAMLVGYRHLDEARAFLSQVEKEDKELLSREIESQKKKFVGHEILGKTLGIIGLGNIGIKVANAAQALGMRVLGYDPHITIANALALMPDVKTTMDLDAVLSSADIITLHVPLTADTTHLINKSNAILIKKQSLLLNFSRERIVCEEAILQQLETHNLLGYITDFPTPKLANHPRVLSFPHLGASTTEAECNSAEMVIRNISNFLEFGIIEHSINYPDTFLTTSKIPNCYRLIVINHNKPGVIADCTRRISQLGYNIERMVNTSRDAIAVNLIDISGINEVPEQLTQKFASIESVIRVHIISLHSA